MELDAPKKVRKFNTVDVSLKIYNVKSGELLYKPDTEKPVTFTVGKKHVISAVDLMVIGMLVGETKAKTAPKEYCYGDVLPELVIPVERSKFEGLSLDDGDFQKNSLFVKDGKFIVYDTSSFKRYEDESQWVGQRLIYEIEGQQIEATIKDFTPTHMILDCNKKWAGLDLHIEVEVLKIY